MRVLCWSSPLPQACENTDVPQACEKTDIGLPWCQFASEITVLKTVKMLIMKLLEMSCFFLGLDPVDGASVLSLLS